MPVNGHTSGVRLFGSDEANADERERRRRMRGPLCAQGIRRLGRRCVIQQRHYDSCRQGYGVLLIGTRLCQRLHRWRGVFLRRLAASLICAAPRIARLFARCIREDASSRRKPRGREEKRDRENCRHANLGEHQPTS